MLQVENISFSYRRGKKEVLHDFSLSLERGRVTGYWERTVPVNLHCFI